MLYNRETALRNKSNLMENINNRTNALIAFLLNDFIEIVQSMVASLFRYIIDFICSIIKKHFISNLVGIEIMGWIEQGNKRFVNIVYKKLYK